MPSAAENAHPAVSAASFTANPVLRAAFKVLLQELGRSSPMDGLPYPIYVRNRGWLQMLDKISEQIDGMELYLQHVAKDGGPMRVARTLRNLFREMTGSSNEDVRPTAHILALIKDYRDRHGALIEVTDALEAMLLASDLDDEIPMSLMALPYPTQYVSFGPAARAQLKLGTEDEKAGYRLNGCFCVQSPRQDGDGYALTFYVVMATPNSRNKTISHLHSPRVEPSKSLNEWVLGIVAELSSDPTVPQDALKLVSYLAKVFLYLGMKEARMRHLQEHSDLSARLTRVEPKKQGKLQKRLQRLYDRIVVGPNALPQDLRQGLGAHGVAPHWRRGHFRMQSHGHAHALRKLIFVRPMLVAANPAAPQDGLAPKTYSTRR